MNIRHIGIGVLTLIAMVPVSASAAGPVRLTYEDLGVLQLVAHDLFRVDRTLEVNLENNKIDLSTVLDHGAGAIAQGGEVRNSENIMVFTMAKKFGDEYLRLVNKGYSPATARKLVVTKYQSAAKSAYLRLTQEFAPKGTTGNVTMTEDLAFRVIHDLLPGTVIVGGVPVPIFDASLAGRTLSSIDLKNLGAPMDGQFDPAFRAITFVIPPSTTIVIDLLERDQSFGTQFGTDFSFDHFLTEASNGKLDKTDKVMIYLRSLMAKGLGN